ncbi:agmatinase [Stackebrandtia nassauensis]|uniref:Agmatinase n=1 Tax=Stackebrandtia nassauensis (strain DSM 44728 / CIP 108903 / NRRL B-16338 / NBRC 102104 / LLR-40K-21) TaxID=446470 RepID=D3PY26_STANL|nr:agmatinase [Stackebrandtia nassauensis]ADD45355.1 agmatinase [Stackebrandtia nassauensis DSM 44728]
MTPENQLPPGLRAQLDSSSYMGVPTFGLRPHLSEPEQLDAWRPDVAIIGAPWDDNTTNRPGARFGPRALRANAYDPGSYHLDLEIEIFDHLDVVDYGDAIVSPGLWEPSKTAIHQRVSEVTTRDIIPVIIGGDHSITWPAALAVGAHHGHGRIGMIHFDAHADTADIVRGNLASHGTPMRRLIESGAITGKHFIQVGLRGYWPPPDVQAWMRAQGMRHHTMQEIWERGIQSVMDDVITEALDGTDGIYISIDIDVLDPGFAPGTGTPEPGGLTPADLLRAVRRIAMDTNVVALDITEVCPPYDHADLTTNNAHRLIWETLAGLAHRRRQTDAAANPPDPSTDAPTN